MGTHRILHQMFEAAYANYIHAAAQTITCTQWGEVFEVTTNGTADTLTLARPTKPGMLCAVVLDVDGGDLTLTVTGGYNADGATSITFGTAGDAVVFYSIQVGTVYYWRVSASEGTNINSLTMGAGFTGGTGGIAVSSVEKIGSIFKTTIFADLTGLASSTTDLDIIGVGTSAAHFGQITAAKNGTLFYGQITWLETPATGVDDIDFYFCTEGTGVFDGGVAALAETILYAKGSSAAAAAATAIALTTVPTADKYMYAVCGAAGTPATYTAGQFLMELWGK